MESGSLKALNSPVGCIRLSRRNLREQTPAEQLTARRAKNAKCSHLAGFAFFAVRAFRGSCKNHRAPSASADAEVTVCLVRYGLIQLTLLSVLVEAADGFASPSVAAAAAIVTTTFPLPVIPVTVTV